MLEHGWLPIHMVIPLNTLYSKKRNTYLITKVQKGDCQHLRMPHLPSLSAPHLDLTPRSSSSLPPWIILANSNISCDGVTQQGTSCDQLLSWNVSRLRSILFFFFETESYLSWLAWNSM